MDGEKDTVSKLERYPTVHEQPDGTILAVAATGTSSRESLLSWIRFLGRLTNYDNKLSNKIRIYTSDPPDSLFSRMIFKVNNCHGSHSKLSQDSRFILILHRLFKIIA